MHRILPLTLGVALGAALVACTAGALGTPDAPAPDEEVSVTVVGAPTPTATPVEAVVVPPVVDPPTIVDEASHDGTLNEDDATDEPDPVIVDGDRPAQAPEDVIDSLPDIVLVPCPEEDSRNCYWDAATMGNGVGRSFVNIDGRMYYEED